MGPAYFVIAILGCADGSQGCTRVATMPAQYIDQRSCAAATSKALEASADLDFPALVAECRAVRSPAGASSNRRERARTGQERQG